MSCINETYKNQIDELTSHEILQGKVSERSFMSVIFTAYHLPFFKGTEIQIVQKKTFSKV